MNDISIKQMPTFRKSYKRLHAQHKETVNKAIKEIVNNPKIGREKKGGLPGIFVHTFKARQQEILLAYEWDPKTRLLLAVGVHENCYRDLKKKR